VPLSLLAIGAAAAWGVILPLSGITSDIGGMGWVVVGMLALISVVSLVQTRYLILPSIFKAHRAGTGPTTFAELERSVSLMVSMFSVATAVYMGL